MEFEMYRTAVLTTESLLEKDHKLDKKTLGHLFSAIDALSDALDLLKKSVFYQTTVPGLSDRVIDKAISATNDLTQLVADFNDGSAFDSDRWESVSNIRMLHSLIGCVGEAGELAKLGAVMCSDSSAPFDRLNWLEEVGDFAWYETLGMDELGFTRDQKDAANEKKLQKRYPAGFSIEAAMNRDYGAEREAMEAELYNDPDSDDVVYGCCGDPEC